MASTQRIREKSTRQSGFRSGAAFESLGIAKAIATYARDEIIYRQGDDCLTVLYIRTGGVKLSVLSRSGREAIVAILTAGDFFGEGCLAGQPRRTGTATALTDSTTIIHLGTNETLERLHNQRGFSHRFISHMLARNIRIEKDLLDQLLNSTEKRLARTLLLLTRVEPSPVPWFTQATLANIVGTTRSRVNVFMKKFERLGFIEYKDGLRVNKELLVQVLQA
jgi:CRP-like cAMP-binding protein